MPLPQTTGVGPNNFVITCSDRYEFNNPGDDNAVQEVAADVAVSVKWDLGRKQASEVVIADPIWTKSGPGPHPVYDDTGPIPRPKGVVQWSITSRWSHTVEIRPDKEASRNIYVVEVMLLRTFIGKDAQGHTGTPVIEIAWNVPQRDIGNWVPIEGQ